MNRYVNSLSEGVDNAYTQAYKRDLKKYLQLHDAVEFRPNINYWALALETVIQLDKKDLRNQQGPEFCRNWYEDILRRKYEADWTDDQVKRWFFYDWAGNLISLFQKSWSYKPEKEPKKYFAFLTFNFHPDTSILTAQTDMKRIFGLSIFRDLKISYSIEYHGETSNHIHYHTLIEFDEVKRKQINKANLDQTIFRQKSLKDYLSIQYQFSYGSGSFRADPNIETYEQYIRGNKADSKLENVKLDIEWRHKHNLEDLYKINH